MTVTTLSSEEAVGRNRGTSGSLDRSGAGYSSSPLSASAISWGAIAAGAAAAASLSLILLMLGVGLGLSSVSPWAREGISATAFGVSTVIWLTVTQLLASGMGGYLAGRLRTRWTEVQADEVYFRDTAHGFLAWAVATLATAALLTSAVGAIVSGGVQAGASVVGGVASIAATAATAAVGGAAASARPTGGDAGPMGYFVDSLFRRPAANTNASTNSPATAGSADAANAANAAAGAPSAGSTATSERVTASETAEVGRIFMNVTRAGPLPPEDLRYVAQIVAQRTGLSQSAAEQRVGEVYTKAQTQLREAETAAREAADKARKASAASALWLFVSLLVGAFVASLAATWGGRSRDA